MSTRNFSLLNQTKSATIILRGGAEQFIKEAERSLNDAIMIVRRCFKTNKVVAGGGATEMELSKGLKEYAVEVSGKEQLVMNMFAKSLEVIPKIIADNAGLDSLDIINKLRHKHCKIYFYFKLKEEFKICTWALILLLELETTLNNTFGNPNWSKLTHLKLPQKLHAQFFQLTKPSETQNQNKKNNKEESKKPFQELVEDEKSIVCIL